MILFDYRDENFVKIDFFLLFEIMNYLINFISNDLVDKISFNFINLFVFQDTRVRK